MGISLEVWPTTIANEMSEEEKISSPLIYLLGTLIESKLSDT